MKPEPTNKYDLNVISVNNDVIIGYVLKNVTCSIKENINKPFVFYVSNQ